MFRVRWAVFGFFLLPIAELAVFLAVASEIGVLAALSILLATSLAGAALIGNAGRGVRSRFRGDAAEHLLRTGMPGVFTVLAGILLLVPGFLTDIAGVLLLIPAVQRRIVAMLLRALGQPRRKTAPVVDLDPDEWRQVAGEDSGRHPEPAGMAHSCPPAPAVLATPPESGNSGSRVKEEQ
jgi:UPF0716 protein FxsA